MVDEIDSLYTIDNLSIRCDFHNIEVLGICGNSRCLEAKLLCMKCCLELENCVNLKKHNLITISEFLHRFFLKQELGILDIQRIKRLFEHVKCINKSEVAQKLSEFLKVSKAEIEKSISELNSKYVSLLKGFIESRKDSTLKIENNFKEAQQKYNNNELFDKDFFEIFDIKNFLINNSENSEKLERLVDFVKNFNKNIDKVSINTKNIENLVYSKSLIDLDLSLTESKIDAGFKKIEDEIDKFLEDLKKDIIPEKNSENFSYSLAFGGVEKFKSNPLNLTFKADITNQCQKSYTIDNVFCAFQSFKNEYLCAWPNLSFHIEIFDFKQNKIIKSVTGHTNQVFVCRHFADKRLRINYLISSSYDHSNRILSSALDYNVLITLNNCHNGYYLYSCAIFFDESKNMTYSISTCANELMKVWDLKGKLIKDIGNTTDYTYFVDVWQDLQSENKDHYIINANSLDVKMYNFRTSELFRTFKSSSPTWHMSAIVHEIQKKPHLIETDGNGNIRFWNIRDNLLVKTIVNSGTNLRGIQLWNDQYLIIASSDKCFKIFDIDKGVLVKGISGHDNVLSTVVKVIHPVYGESLLTAAIDGKIKLWVSSDKN